MPAARVAWLGCVQGGHLSSGVAVDAGKGIAGFNTTDGTHVAPVRGDVRPVGLPGEQVGACSQTTREVHSDSNSCVRREGDIA
jgi:hypothetical protein